MRFLAGAGRHRLSGLWCVRVASVWPGDGVLVSGAGPTVHALYGSPAVLGKGIDGSQGRLLRSRTSRLEPCLESGDLPQ